jgi:hypothetical protein
MSARALEFVETWVSEKIEEESCPEQERQQSAAKEWAAECRDAAMQEGILGQEIDEAFDDLVEFIEGQVEEARERVQEE